MNFLIFWIQKLQLQYIFVTVQLQPSRPSAKSPGCRIKSPLCKDFRRSSFLAVEIKYGTKSNRKSSSPEMGSAVCIPVVAGVLDHETALNTCANRSSFKTDFSSEIALLDLCSVISIFPPSEEMLPRATVVRFADKVQELQYHTNNCQSMNHVKEDVETLPQCHHSSECSSMLDEPLKDVNTEQPHISQSRILGSRDCSAPIKAIMKCCRWRLLRRSQQVWRMGRLSHRRPFPISS